MSGIVLSDEKDKSSPWHPGAGLSLPARPWCSPVEHNKLHLTECYHQAKSPCGPDEMKQARPLHNVI